VDADFTDGTDFSDWDAATRTLQPQVWTLILLMGLIHLHCAQPQVFLIGQGGANGNQIP
jgi:hypothetical protein